MKRPLYRYLQETGYASRRVIRALISQGECRVNGQPVTDPRFPVETGKDRVTVHDKEIIWRPEKKAYYLLNKPRGVITTLQDPRGRPTILDLIQQIPERVYPVGRLDYHSEGLILLTNDGRLTQFIIASGNSIPKVYRVRVRGILLPGEISALRRKGVTVSGRKIKPRSLRLLGSPMGGNTRLEISVTEGKKHLVRIFFSRAGYPVQRLKRTAIGSFRIAGIPPGHWREITGGELKKFAAAYQYHHRLTG